MSATKQLPHHGQKWSREEDNQIIDAPTLQDSHFSSTLGRSVHAVQSRRATLAARLHAKGGHTIQECAEQLGADVEKTMAAQYSPPGKPTSPRKSTPLPKPKTPISILQHTPLTAICNHIKRSRGNINGLWTQDALVPTLVQHYAGFMAYAAYLKDV